MKIRVTNSRHWYVAGEVFDVLENVMGPRIPDGADVYPVAHPKNDDDTTYIVYAKDCEIISEEDASMTTVLPDESLGSVEREYREVRRKARVGDVVKYDGYKARVARVVADGGVANYPKETFLSTANNVRHNALVLEPTDIIRVNGVRYRMVNRKACEGDLVIVVNLRCAIDCGTGDVYTAVEVHETGSVTIKDRSGDKNRLFSDEYAVLEPLTNAEPLSSRSAAEQCAENIARLERRIAELEERVKRLSNPVKAKTLAERSAQPPTRDEIIEKAKRDVADLLNMNHPRLDGEGAWFTDKDGSIITDRCDFVVNRKKRTVVALIRYLDDGKVWRTGRAKCAPGDVFNTHIGRAIALRRALGLDVPDEYVNAPKPTEPRVGDIVIGRLSGVKANVGRVENGWCYGVYEDGDTLQATFSQLNVIDDSRENGEDGGAE